VARTTGTRSLADLIRDGVLKSGERLVINRRSAPPIEGTLQADGSIKYKGQTYRAPSTAAKIALDVGSIDGWLRWRVPRLDSRSLAELRDQA
jgi:hypothetical protein